MRPFASAFATSVLLLLTPAAAHAQGVISGYALGDIVGTPGVVVDIEFRDSAGVLVLVTQTGDGGHEGPPQGWYSVGLPAGTYFVRTRHASTNPYWVNEAHDNIICLPSCSPTAGTPVVVTDGQGVTVNFLLAPGAPIKGIITNDGTGAGLAGVLVKVYAPNGQWMTDAITDASGAYQTDPLPLGSYYARTSNSLGFRDEIHNGIAWCDPICQPVTGDPIALVILTRSTVDFALTPATNLVQNGDFSGGLAQWGLFATPDLSYIVADVTAGTFRFYRVPPPPGTANQAVVLQQTGAGVASGSGMVLQFDAGNSSDVRKRLTVLLHESDFSDLTTCTFWLPPQTPLRRYGLRAHTTRAWANATVALYAASAGSNGGFYEIDNVSLQTVPAAPTPRVDCVDPDTSGAPGGPDSADVMTNGDFASGSVTPGWALFGQIQGQVTGGIFEFVKLPGSPAGVILQPTGQTAALGEHLTATFQLGNTSAARQRVTVILHDRDFTDLSACTFWLAPGQPLATYTYRAFATRPWTETTVSVYPATAGGSPWIQLDNVTLRRTPSAVMTGTECVEPDATTPIAIAGRGSSAATPAAQARSFAVRLSEDGQQHVAMWTGPLDASWDLQMSTDGRTWTTVGRVGPLDLWMDLDLNLPDHAGEWIRLRLVAPGTK